MKELALVCALLVPASASAMTLQEEAKAFVETYSAIYKGVQTSAAEAQWKASTDVKPEHEGERVGANSAMTQVTGNTHVINKVREFLKRKSELDPLLVRQLNVMWRMAAENPNDIPETVKKRVEAESKQSSAMDSFEFCLEKGAGGKCAKPTTANDIDVVMESTATDAATHLKVWLASKEIGKPLKPGLVTLRGLRNEVARHFDYASYFDLQVSAYDMKTDEMMATLDGALADIKPLYEQLHCYAKHELAKRYGQPVPKGPIPAHWLGNRWGQSWPGLVEGVDLDPLFKSRKPEWMIKQGEKFYVSMGFDPLPKTFWSKSDLYPVPQTVRKKNTHASAWHVDLQDDVRSLMSVLPDSKWWSTVHHELGHIYYYQSYTRPEVPPLLRTGAMPAFHEGFGDLISIASMQVPYLKQAGILPKDKTIDERRWLLDEAFTHSLVFLPWSAGTMAHWERDVYAGGLSPDQWNKRWWEYVRKYQGIEPPSARGEEYCDACTKTHINDNPAYYYTYAVGTIFKYQVHDHLCRVVLKQDPRNCNYFGRKEAGDYLKSFLSKGGTQDWRALLKEATGSELSSKPMMEYYKPLLAYLQQENKGRTCGW
jgi:peptidyl-dipeptidase A